MDFLSRLNAVRVLVAESSPDEMDHTTAILEGAGYNVHKAYYAADAVFALNNNQFDLALVDAQMFDPEQRALTLQMYRYAPMRWIALVDDRYHEPERLLRQGAATLVRRPFRTDDFLQQIENILEGRSTLPPVHDPAPRREGDIQSLLEQRLVEHQTLSALARMLSAELDVDSLLAQVVDAAVRLCNAEEGLLLLPDEEGTALYIRAVKGIDSETAQNFRIKTQDTLAGKVFQTGQPILVGDQGWQKVKTEYLVKSLLYVPLSLKGKTIGVLGVNNKQSERTFSKHDSELLQDLAAHAAIAIENARLYEESVLRARELSFLAQAGEAANSTLEIDEVLSIIAGQLMSTLEVAQCYIGEWHPDQEQLRTLATSYRAVWRAGDGYSFAPDASPEIEQSFSQQQVFLATPSPPDDPVLGVWMPHRYRAGKIAYLPLFAQGQALGIVTLSYLAVAWPKPEHLQAVRGPLQQIALDMVVTLAGPDIEQQQKTLFRSAQRLLDTAKADWCEVALWNPAQRRFNTMLSYGKAIWREGLEPGVSLDQSPHLRRIMTEQTALTSTLADDLQYLKGLGHGKSILGLPLLIRGKTAGLVLLTDTLHKRRFSRREVKLAHALVLQAANALANARLYRDLQDSLSELHRTQTRLVQTARMSAMGELAAAVAHQINNPLTTVLGDTELVLGDLSPDDPNAESLQAIYRAGKRAHEVVRRLLTMARQQSPNEQRVPLDVNETINGTLMLVRSHVVHGNVALSVDLEDNLPAVLGAQGQLEDVWMNLLLNARDAVSHSVQPEIGIASSHDRTQSQIMVTIWDNGTGIPEDMQSRIFEPFFTTKPAGEGTGLGLHICRQIVEKFGGNIYLQSERNKGTRFIVYLPVFHEE
jgi:signal transduction histidine kinase/DNA-binding response OmpR family regulator